MVRNYTVRRHIRRLEAMIEEPNLCKLCPASMMFNSKEHFDFPWSNDPCKVCLTFINLKYKLLHTCPCMQLGKEEAVRRTLKAIKKFRLKSQ